MSEERGALIQQTLELDDVDDELVNRVFAFTAEVSGHDCSNVTQWKSAVYKLTADQFGQVKKMVESFAASKDERILVLARVGNFMNGVTFHIWAIPMFHAVCKFNEDSVNAKLPPKFSEPEFMGLYAGLLMGLTDSQFLSVKELTTKIMSIKSPKPRLRTLRSRSRSK